MERKEHYTNRNLDPDLVHQIMMAFFSRFSRSHAPAWECILMSLVSLILLQA